MGVDATEAFNALIGTHVQILHEFTGFTDPLPTTILNQIEAYGATPLLDWACTNVSDVAAGRDDSVISAYAQSLRAFAHPVFLRWYWEMNRSKGGNCNAQSDPTAFVTAWKHIWTIFQQQHASNVAFVWCPGGSRDVAKYYPGDQYVDWIGDDRFAHSAGSATFDKLFGTFYKQWSGHGKPIMTGATAAAAAYQAAFLRSVQTTLPTVYPDVKAFIYFDAPGKIGKGNYTLQGTGAAAFKTLAADPYFSYGRR